MEGIVLHKVFDTADLPVRERADAWKDFIADQVLPSTFQIERGHDFQGALRAADLGATQLVASVQSSLRGHRTSQQIRRSDPELYGLALSLRGQQGMVQSGQGGAVNAGEMVLFSSSKPYELWVDSSHGTAASVLAQIPRTMLPLPGDKLDRLLASTFPARDGMGALLAHFLEHLASDTGTYRPADGPRLGMVLLDLVTALLAHALDDTSQVPPESHQRTLFLRIKAYIHRHLAEPDLSAALIAAAHHVSSRHVQRLFQQHGHSVAAYIRHQRLEHARRDLADPGLAHKSIHAIAARWGLTHPEVFTRTFRNAYGVVPRDYRARFLRGPGEQHR
jgi:AraC-like DNA-binding protein